ncbi:MAG: hypothetical protein GKR92_11180 [Gammaproteobacteria bacterium]|nr:MAG: hypothetical protein GKR92_11180 [Gammaproteobacteria bacterium]
MFKKYKAVIGGNKYVIKEDLPEVGWYLFVYENDICIKDYLQETLAIAKEQAQEDCSVPENAWEEI